jgi:cell division protein FtsI/penicillin-binding protein 2
VAAYLRAFQSFDANAMAKGVQQPAPALAPAVADMKARLQVTSATVTPGHLTRAHGGVDAPFDARLQLAGIGEVRYRGLLHLVHANSRWVVAWGPNSLHPALQTGMRFSRSRQWPVRAPILDDAGAPLASMADAVSVGIEPDHMTDQAAVQAAFFKVLAVDPAKVTSALAKPRVREDVFVPITTVRADRFATVRPALEPVPGIVFQKASTRQSPTDGLAAHVVGRVGEVTAERLKQLGEPYAVGDTVGLSGLEGAQERRLAGTPTIDVRVVDAKAQQVASLLHRDGTAPQAVTTTIDVVVQRAAEQALSTVTQPAALVAVDTATGGVRAVVSRPLDQEFNRALAGRYPPGSTFKVVTSAALLQNGTTPDTPTTCAPTTNVGGRTFKNFEGEEAGSIPFREAFAISCNTSFVSLAAKLPPAALGDAATAFGFGTSYDVGLPAAGGQFPAPADLTEKAASAIGQGRVVASPLHMATVAAAVANGTWRPPALLTDPAPTGARPAPTPLPAGVAATLTNLMAGVVQSSTGTGTAANVPGPPVMGKTGTAEFGSSTPPTTHAWFIGFRGTLAFAVFVEGGGVGGRVAAPLAAAFLRAVPAGR